MRKINDIIAIVLIALVITATSVAAEEKASPDYPVDTTIVLMGDNSRKGTEAIPVKAGDCFKVLLYAAGGTGYEWVLAAKNLKLVEPVGESVGPVDDVPVSVGGQVRWTFYLRLKDEAIGTERLRFVLQRPGEKNEERAQVFDLTVMAKK